MDFKKCAPWALSKDIWEFAKKEIGTPDVHTDTRFDKAVRAKRIMSHTVSTCDRPEKHNENEDSPKCERKITWAPKSLI